MMVLLVFFAASAVTWMLLDDDDKTAPVAAIPAEEPGNIVLEIVIPPNQSLNTS